MIRKCFVIASLLTTFTKSQTTITQQQNNLRTCEVGYCLQCFDNDPYECKTCQDFYKVERNTYNKSVCRPDFIHTGCRVEHCEACKNKTTNLCISCANGYYSVSSKDECNSYGIPILFVCMVIFSIPPCLFLCVYCGFNNCSEELGKNIKNVKNRKKVSLSKIRKLIDGDLTNLSVGKVSSDTFEKREKEKEMKKKEKAEKKKEKTEKKKEKAEKRKRKREMKRARKKKNSSENGPKLSNMLKLNQADI